MSSLDDTLNQASSENFDKIIGDTELLQQVLNTLLNLTQSLKGRKWYEVLRGNRTIPIDSEELAIWNKLFDFRKIFNNLIAQNKVGIMDFSRAVDFFDYFKGTVKLEEGVTYIDVERPKTSGWKYAGSDKVPLIPLTREMNIGFECSLNIRITDISKSMSSPSSSRLLESGETNTSIEETGRLADLELEFLCIPTLNIDGVSTPLGIVTESPAGGQLHIAKVILSIERGGYRFVGPNDIRAGLNTPDQNRHVYQVAAKSPLRVHDHRVIYRDAARPNDYIELAIFQPQDPNLRNIANYSIPEVPPDEGMNNMFKRMDIQMLRAVLKILAIHLTRLSGLGEGTSQLPEG